MHWFRNLNSLLNSSRFGEINFDFDTINMYFWVGQDSRFGSESWPPHLTRTMWRRRRQGPPRPARPCSEQCMSGQILALSLPLTLDTSWSKNIADWSDCVLRPNLKRLMEANRLSSGPGSTLPRKLISSGTKAQRYKSWDRISRPERGPIMMTGHSTGDVALNAEIRAPPLQEGERLPSSLRARPQG